MGEGGEAGNKNLNLLADSLLMMAGGWGLQAAKEHPYAAVGFGLFAAKGLMGLVGYVSDDSTVSSVKTEVGKLAKNFGIPCFVTEMTTANGCIPKEVSPEFFLIPVMDWAWKMADKEFDKVYLSMSHGHSLGVGNACVIKEGGVKDSVAFDVFLSTLVSQEIVDPEYTTALEAIGNFLMWATMQKKLPF